MCEPFSFSGCILSFESGAGSCWCSHAEAGNLHCDAVEWWFTNEACCPGVFNRLPDEGSSSLASPFHCATFNKRTKKVMVQKPLWKQKTQQVLTFIWTVVFCNAQNLQFSSPCRVVLMALMWWRNFGKIFALCKWSGTYWHLTVLPVCSASTACFWLNIPITIFRGQRGHRHGNWSKPPPEAAIHPSKENCKSKMLHQIGNLMQRLIGKLHTHVYHLVASVGDHLTWPGAVFLFAGCSADSQTLRVLRWTAFASFRRLPQFWPGSVKQGCLVGSNLT